LIEIATKRHATKNRHPRMDQRSAFSDAKNNWSIDGRGNPEVLGMYTTSAIES